MHTCELFIFLEIWGTRFKSRKNTKEESAISIISLYNRRQLGDTQFGDVSLAISIMDINYTLFCEIIQTSITQTELYNRLGF